MKHLSSGLRVGLAIAFCATLLAPVALADNGKKPPGDSPGNSASAPGQEKKDEAPPPQPAPPQAEPPQPLPAGTDESPPVAVSEPVKSKDEHPAKPEPQPAPPPKREEPGRPAKPAKTEARPPARSSVGTSETNGNSGKQKTAHDKVLICHATGSATNPYVVISVSVNAWSKGTGHGAHPDDRFIDWSWPGDPRQKDDSLCPAGAPGATSSTSTPTSPATTGSSTSSTPTPVGVPRGDFGSPPAGSGMSDPAASSSTVRGADRSAGVLVTSGQLGRIAVKGTLPFTGFPLWSVALVALGLIALGFALRRRWARATG